MTRRDLRGSLWTALKPAFGGLAVALVLFMAGAWLAADRVGTDPLVLAMGVLILVTLGAVPTLSGRHFAGLAVPALLGYAAVRTLVVAEPRSVVVVGIEALALLALGWLVHDLFIAARRLGQKEVPLALPGLDELPRLSDDPLDPAQRQFLLASRHEHPLSCIVIEVDEASLDEHLEQAGGDNSRSFLVGYALRWAARVATESTRRSDLAIAGSGPRRLALLCPQTTAKNAVRVAQKIARALDDQLELETRFGVATFPDQALTLQELVQLAESSVDDPSRLGDTGQLVMPFAAARGTDGDETAAQPVTGRAVGSGLSPGSSIAWEPALEKPTMRERAGWWGKRAFDLVLVGLFAPLWLPLLGLIALAIKVTSPGAPVLFEQVRVGRWGRRFRMLKFRTMVPEAEELKKGLRPQSEMRWPDFKLKDDPRITPVGRFLRQTSLDEVPQLVNVLRGEMSLVGPRPTSFSDDTYTLWQKARLTVLPGLTGLWQINGRGSSDFEQRARIDISYIERRNLWLDMWILFRTASVVFNRRGGY